MKFLGGGEPIKKEFKTKQIVIKRMKIKFNMKIN
jgi:hypothetical protein